MWTLYVDELACFRNCQDLAVRGHLFADCVGVCAPAHLLRHSRDKSE